jgi:hypothetical protein
MRRKPPQRRGRRGSSASSLRPVGGGPILTNRNLTVIAGPGAKAAPELQPLQGHHVLRLWTTSVLLAMITRAVGASAYERGAIGCSTADDRGWQVRRGSEAMSLQSITLASVVCQASDVIDAGLPEGETAIMNTMSGNYFVLNPVGSSIWELLREPVIVGDICNRLLDQFDVERDECVEETLDYLSVLLDEQLVVVVPPDSPTP